MGRIMTEYEAFSKTAVGSSSKGTAKKKGNTILSVTEAITYNPAKSRHVFVKCDVTSETWADL